MIKTTHVKKALIIIPALILAFPLQTLAYNKSWDQGHNCVQGLPGASGWGRYGYDTTSPAHYRGGEYSSKDCCELLCKLCPVYANTGRLQKTFTDLAVPGVGPSLTITRTYLSQDWATTLLGRGWVFNLGKRLIIARSNEGEKIVVARQETGENNFFEEHPDGTLELLSDYGVTYELVKNDDGTYSISNKDGSVQRVDADGKLTRIIDKNGNELSFEYNSVGCLSRITNASGNFVDFQLGPNGKIAGISDNLGRTVTYTYDENGNLTASSDPMGNTTQYIYDGENRLTRVIDPRGNTVFAVTYDGFQPPRIATFTEKGETWTITYYSDRTVKKDSSAHTWTYYFNDLGIIEKVIDPLGNVKQQHHNKVTSTSLDWQDDENGNRTSYTYDADGNIVGKTDPLGNTWTYTYVAGTGRIETETNPLGVVTRYEYDENGNRTKLIRDFGGVLENATTYTYDGSGNMTSVTDPLANTTTYEYNANGNPTKTTDPLGNITTYTYDGMGNRLTETDALGNTTTHAYDLMGRLISTTDALGNVTTYAYDGNGNRTSQTNALGNTTTFVYDAYNRLMQVIDPLGNTTSYTYDKNNKILTMTDDNGNVTRYQYDVLGRKIRIIDALGSQTTFAYDARGNLISLTDANGNTTTFSYDANGRLIEKTLPDGATFAYSYDAIGSKVSETDARGYTTTLTYDSLERLVTKTYHDGSAASYTYDLLDRVLTGTNAESTLVYAYDPLGRVTQATSNGKVIAYSHDAVGNRISLSTPEGETIQYSYNAAGQMARMELSSGKGIDYSYDAVGRIIRKDYSGGNYSLYTFDAAGRLSQLRHLRSDGSSIYSQANTFDNLWNIVSKETDRGATTYGYDSIYQLTSASHPTQPAETFTYDPVGNRMTSADHSVWSYNNRSQLTSYDGTTFTYDRNGNTLTKVDGSGATQYSYDYENRLTRIDLSDGGQATYKYDVHGRRIEKNVSTEITRYVYERYLPLAEYDSSGSLKRNYFYGFGDINPSISYDRGSIYYLYHDHLNTPKAITSETGSIEWESVHSAFGKGELSLENIESHFRFPGQYFDRESNLHYNHARIYDPLAGRYLQADTIDLVLRHRTWKLNHQYVYADSNPISLADPLGRAPCPLGEHLTVLLAVGPWDVITAYNLANQALSLASSIGLQGLHDGRADAFRHCFWSCRMAQEIGVSDAKQVGDIHEDCNPNPAAERAMDLYNNAKGISFGDNGSTDCKDACLNAACDGTLMTIL